MDAMDRDARLKRLKFRAWHRGVREADMLVGGYYDRWHGAWSETEIAWFERFLEEQDVDILAWAHNVCEPPERFSGPMVEALKKLDYIQIAK